MQVFFFLQMQFLTLHKFHAFKSAQAKQTMQIKSLTYIIVDVFKFKLKTLIVSDLCSSRLHVEIERKTLQKTWSHENIQSQNAKTKLNPAHLHLSVNKCFLGFSYPFKSYLRQSAKV